MSPSETDVPERNITSSDTLKLLVSVDGVNYARAVWYISIVKQFSIRHITELRLRMRPMLRNINPILSPQLLYVLRAMGHGDEIALVDSNFPAESIGPECIRADGSSATEILKAVLEVLPLDTFVPHPALCMQVVDDPQAVPDTIKDFQAIINDTADAPSQIQSLERFAFYDRAKISYAVVQTGEHRLYGNIIIKKGVVK